MADPGPPFAPQQYGRYLLHRLLAEGGMAEVFLAQQLGAEGVSKLVAVKRILPHLSRQPEFVAMFLDEARLASNLSHPNVVQVFDFGEFEGRYYLAMEYLAGENLGAVTRLAHGTGKPIPLQVAVQLMIGACDGLHYAHELTEHGKPLNLVHRDISPSNIMVSYQGGVKLLDFGIAHAAERRQERTETGVVKGKYPYCSPEQLSGSAALDRRSDLFSLGIVFHELVTGRRLFKRESDVQTCFAVINDPIPSVCAARSDLPQALDRVLRQALERQPERRYQTALELRKEIDRLQSGPPVRLDEYMVELFGQEHVQEQLNIGSGLHRLPTAIETAKQSISDPIPPPPATRSEAPTAVRPLEAAPVLPDAVRTLSSPTRRPRTARLPLLLSGAAGLLLLGGLAMRWGQGQPLPAGRPQEAPAASFSSLEIDSLPRGARLEVCGRQLEQLTPARVGSLPPGRCVVAAELEGYQRATQLVELLPGERKALVLTLAPRRARLELKAPAGARLWVDGVDRGEARALELEPGPRTLRVQLGGHKPFEQEMTLKPGDTTRVEAHLAPLPQAAPGIISVSCLPWCRVFLDGVDVGKPSPIVGMKVPAGRHTLKLEHPPSGRSRELVIQVKSGAEVRESASFR